MKTNLCCRLVWICVALASFASGATFAKVYKDPIAKMMDRAESQDRRLTAARQAERELPDDPRRIKALEEMAWKRTHPWELRNYAIDQLIARDEAGFREQLYRRASLLSDWKVINHVFDVGVQRQWPGFDVFVVRHYTLISRGTVDSERPERAVLKKLHPDKTPEQVVFDVFADFDDTVPAPEQISAWQLLARMHDHDELLRLLTLAPDRSAFIVDLKTCARDLRTVPTNKEGILWLSNLRSSAKRDWWNRATAAAGRLTADQAHGLELRHFAPLLHAGDSIFSVSRSDLLQRVGARLEGQRHHLSGPTFDGGSKDHPQRFAEAAGKFCWGDLVTIDMLWSAVQQPDLVAAFFNQADADHKDEGTEYGGVLDVGDDGRYRLSLYRPKIAQHDLKFIPPDAMIVQLYSGLAHYHFHAQHIDNSFYAGPGLGDLNVADNLSFNYIVLTFIDRNTMNVDYFQPGRIVVDLGTIKR